MLCDYNTRDPFYFSLTSKGALSVLRTAQEASNAVPVVLHMDSTFKVNINEFPVLVLGISDAQQQFHMLSISVMSHHNEAMYSHLLSAFKDVIRRELPDVTFTPEYAMTDCDVAER